MAGLRLRAGGMLRPGELYVPPAVDTDAPAWLRAGEIVVVLGSRQTGKSSLRLRLTEALRGEAWVGGFELTALSTATSAEMLFHTLAEETVNALLKGRGPGVEALRTKRDALLATKPLEVPAQHWIRVLREIVALAEGRQVVLLWDEIDSTLRLPAQLLNDLWINVRGAAQDDAIRPHLSFGLFGVQAPDDSITDRERTPFNNCRRVDLDALPWENFDRAALAALGCNPEVLLDAMLGWTGGHPYFTQALLMALLPQAPLGSDEAVQAAVDAAVHRVFLERGVSEDSALGAMDRYFRPFGMEQDRTREEVLDAGAILRTDAEVLDALRDYERVREAGERVVERISPTQNRLLRIGLLRQAVRPDGTKVLLVRNRVIGEVFGADWVNQRWAGLTRPLKEGVSAWIAGGRSEAYVFRGERLKKALAWAQTHSDELSQDERDFLDAGRDVERAELLRERRRRNVLIGVLVLFVLGLSIAFGVTRQQYQRAEHEAEEARASAANARRAGQAQREEAARANASAESAQRAERVARRAEEQSRQAESRAQENAEQARGAQLQAMAQRNTADQQRQRAVRSEIDGRIQSLLNALSAQVGQGLQAVVSALSLMYDLDHGDGRHPEEIAGVLMRASSLIDNSRHELPTIMLRGHKNRVGSVEFSADGSRVLTSSWDGTARVWDARRGSTIATLRGHSGHVYGAGFLSDPARVITVGAERTARVWASHDGMFLSAHCGGGELFLDHCLLRDACVVSVSRSGVVRVCGTLDGADFEAVRNLQGTVVSVSNGRAAVVGRSDRQLRIWDLLQGSVVSTLDGSHEPYHGVRFSEDGRWLLAVGESPFVRVWDVRTGVLRSTLQGHESTILSAEFSLDGERVVTAGTDHSAQVWETQSGRNVAILSGHRDIVGLARFTRDGVRVVTGDYSGNIGVWDARSGGLVTLWQVGRGSVNALDVSFDGARVVASVGFDGTVGVWDIRAERHSAELAHPDAVMEANFSRDSSRVLTRDFSGRIGLWDSENGRLMAVIRDRPGIVASVDISRDNGMIVTAGADETPRIWSARTGQLVVALQGHHSRVVSGQFSPDGGRVVTASVDRTARVWEVNTGRLLVTFQGHLDAVMIANFSLDGDRVLTVCADNAVRLWDVRSGQLGVVIRMGGQRIRWAQLSADSRRVVVVGESGNVRVYDAHNGQPLADLRRHQLQVDSAAFSNDGQQFVTVGDGRIARVWDADSGQLVSLLQGHQDIVTAASFSPDGTRVVTMSLDHTARVWDARSGQLQAVLRGHQATLTTARFSPDGRRIVTAALDGTARLWQVDLEPMRRELCRAIAMVDSVWNDPAHNNIRRVCRAPALPPRPAQGTTMQP